MKKIIPIVIAALSVVAAIFFYKSGGRPVAPKIVTVVDTFRVESDENSITHANIAYDPGAKQEMKEALTKEYFSYTVDTLAPALKIAQDEIDRLTRVNARLSGRVALSNIDTSKSVPVSHYAGRYMTITVHDTIAEYSYNATLDFVDYHKKKWLFGKDQYYTDISSPDKSFRIFGVQTYRRSFQPEKDKLSISTISGIHLGRKSSIQTGIKARFNPDGILTPYAVFGREFFFNSKPAYFISGGVEFNIYRK